jgi:biopolymer transport protein ExbB
LSVLTDLHTPLSDQNAQVADLLHRAQSALELGGPVVVILLAMSFIALTIFMVKLLQFGWLQIGRQRPALRALHAWRVGDPEMALTCVTSHRDPTSQLMARAIRGRQMGLAEEGVREEVLRYGGDVLFQLRRGLRPLEAIGMLAPLLGLLGTVLGMIKAFQQLEASGVRVDPAVLSGGIWEALVTTAVGLSVAIPVIAVSTWLERRVDHLAHNMDNLVTQVFTKDLSADISPSMAPKKGSQDAHAEESLLQAT